MLRSGTKRAALVGSPFLQVEVEGYLADLAVAKRLLISSQLTVFHQAAR